MSNIKEKISGNFEKMDDKTLYAIFGVILLSIFLLDYFALMRPQLATLTKINPEIKLLSEDIGKAQTEIQRLKQYESQVQQLEEQITKENQKVEPKEEVPIILEHISRIANDHDVKINHIMPNVIDSDIILENNERVYYSLPIEIEAKSGYHNFGRFINTVENEKIFLQVRKITIASIGDSKQHSIKLTLDAIVYESADE